MRFTFEWTITEVDEDAIATLPATAWIASLDQEATATDAAQVAELTDLNARTKSWIEGLRLLVRRTKPSRRHRNKLTAFEQRTGWRYAIVATNITRTWDVTGSHHPQWIDCLHRSRHSPPTPADRGDLALGRPLEICWRRLLATSDPAPADRLNRQNHPSSTERSASGTRRPRHPKRHAATWHPTMRDKTVKPNQPERSKNPLDESRL